MRSPMEWITPLCAAADFNLAMPTGIAGLDAPADRTLMTCHLANVPDRSVC